MLASCPLRLSLAHVQMEVTVLCLLSEMGYGAKLLLTDGWMCCLLHRLAHVQGKGFKKRYNEIHFYLHYF